MKKLNLLSSNRLLLACGIAGSVYFVLINMFVPLLWSDYSVVDQTVSELSAIGAPTRTLWLAVGWPYAVLYAFFGWGVVSTFSATRWLRIVGWLFIAYGAFTLYWPAMHTREILAAGGATISDTLHLAWAGITVLFFVLIMTFSALALDWKFRIYTIVSVLLLITFGMLTSMQAPNVDKNLATPLIGVWERVNTGIFLLWVIVLAVILLKKESRNKL